MNKIVDVASAIVIVAGIMVLVRPGSQGPQLVNSIGWSFSQALLSATGAAVPTGAGWTPAWH